jgi:hypothetical protein
MKDKEMYVECCCGNLFDSERKTDFVLEIILQQVLRKLDVKGTEKF